MIERSGRWLRVGAGSRCRRSASRALGRAGRARAARDRPRLEARCFDRPDGYAPPREPDRVAFDADRAARAAHRARRAARGERFAPFGGAGERRLKSLLIDAGVPRWERARVPLLEADGEIVWVVGLRRGRGGAGDRTTTRVSWR